MASKAIFITLKELKENSIIDGNLDPDKLIQFVKVAQDTHIQNYLGGKLYQKLQDLLIDGEMDNAENSDYKTLWIDYVKPMLIWYSQADFIPFAPYQITNGGVYKPRAENSEMIEKSELSMLISRATDKADFYARRFVDYMDFYSHLYPEYNSTTNGEMYPDKEVNFYSFYLG